MQIEFSRALIKDEPYIDSLILGTPETLPEFTEFGFMNN